MMTTESLNQYITQVTFEVESETTIRKRLKNITSTFTTPKVEDAKSVASMWMEIVKSPATWIIMGILFVIGLLIALKIMNWPISILGAQLLSLPKRTTDEDEFTDQKTIKSPVNEIIISSNEIKAVMDEQTTTYSQSPPSEIIEKESSLKDGFSDQTSSTTSKSDNLSPTNKSSSPTSGSNRAQNASGLGMTWEEYKTWVEKRDLYQPGFIDQGQWYEKIYEPKAP